jgi:ketosteroid isomerase-like protein
MSELDDFLTPTLTRQLEAEKALCNGDAGPRLAMWSTQDPVTVLGAMKDVIGSEEVRQVFHWLATRFSNCTDYRFELVAADASGDLAYTLGYEHFSFSMDGGPVQPPPCASPTSIAARTASGRPSTAMPTPLRPVSSLPPSVDGVSVPARGQGRAGATSGPHPSRASRTTAVTSGRPTSQLSRSLRSASQDVGATPVLSRTEEVRGSKCPRLHPQTCK